MVIPRMKKVAVSPACHGIQSADAPALILAQTSSRRAALTFTPGSAMRSASSFGPACHGIQSADAPALILAQTSSRRAALTFTPGSA
ncbi:hypothetical protein CNY89_11885, partial [Amaricoccus sp. HAR-UPW-R2A-40]